MGNTKSLVAGVVIGAAVVVCIAATTYDHPGPYQISACPTQGTYVVIDQDSGDVYGLHFDSRLKLVVRHHGTVTPHAGVAVAPGGRAIANGSRPVPSPIR